ncbi:threonine synthase-like protein [Lineolata rhizophorae]|uniref:threonine synthase n=1 Tax=Lineolata rhizophorae TaxID=578093 RepID=A0A6A6NZB0_9PEZI|nr:threonine synthase-like protein [Lineolata rhizophorae]
MVTHTPSQRYLSTRGGSYDLSFEEVVLKGLASDGGLFIPEEIPSLPSDWVSKWLRYSFVDLAFEIFSFFISPSEIPPEDLKHLIERSYSTFRSEDVTPLVTLKQDKGLHLLELFHGPTFAFKDVALQFLGNLFEYFLVRRNEGKKGRDREHLTVIGATSGDTGSAAIYGLRGKKDVSVFIMHPHKKISPVQEAQMTTVLDPNVHNLAVDGTFDDCQDFVKALFADPEINKTHRLAAVNSINWARILAQITYYLHAYLTLIRDPSHGFASGGVVRFVVPTGNFGDVLAGYFAKSMGLPAEKLLVATNENDILHRFWVSGRYEKHPLYGAAAEGGIPADGVKSHPEGVKETLSPAMDILVSSNFERLLWFLAHEVHGADLPSAAEKRRRAGESVNAWLQQLKSSGGFAVDAPILTTAQRDFESERVSDMQTVETIELVYDTADKPPASAWSSSTPPPPTPTRTAAGSYVLDPHSAVAVCAALRSVARCEPAPATQHIALATAHPAKFARAVEMALNGKSGFKFVDVLPKEFVGLEDKTKRLSIAKKDEGWQGVRKIVIREVELELAAAERKESEAGTA